MGTEALMASLVERERQLDEADREIDTLRAENERLRQERDEARAEWHRHNVRADHERHLRSRAEEEVERLRRERDWLEHAAFLAAVDALDAATPPATREIWNERTSRHRDMPDVMGWRALRRPRHWDREDSDG